MADLLVVDDDADIRMLVAFALEDAGHTVRQAADGTEALIALTEAPPALMVLDVMMPTMDGFGVLRWMKESRLADDDVRVIILTCRTEEREHLLGWELGADEYLTKPFDPEDLVSRVSWLLAAGPELRAERRRVERGKTELLDRLEAAFRETQRQGRDPSSDAPPGPAHLRR